MLQTDKSAEPRAVVHDRHHRPRSDPHHTAQRRGIGRIDLHGFVDRRSSALGKDNIGFERRSHRIAHDIAGAQLLHVVDPAQVTPADESLGLPLGQRPDGPQVTRPHGVDAKARGRHGFGHDASRTILPGRDGIFAPDTDIGSQAAVDRIADAVAKRHILRDTEDLPRSAVLQQAHGFVLRQAQPPKSVVVHGIGVERPQINRIGPPFHLHPGHKSCLGIGLGTQEHDAAYKQSRQRQEYRYGADFTV